MSWAGWCLRCRTGAETLGLQVPQVGQRESNNSCSEHTAERPLRILANALKDPGPSKLQAQVFKVSFVWEGKLTPRHLKDVLV